MAIPSINGDFIPAVQKDRIKKKNVGMDDAAFEAKITQLQSNCEGYVKTFIGNIDKIDDDSWVQLKQLYVQWNIYAELENESISKDKGDTLNNLLKSISKRVNGKDEDKPEKGVTGAVTYII